MSALLSKLTTIGGARALMDYEEAKRTASDGDGDARRALARRTDVQPEILYYLAEDPEPGIRREIAANRTTPVQADLLLSRDADEEVRCRVAGKIAALAPQLTDAERDKVGGIVVEILHTLAQDQIVRVRAILAEELRAAEGVPPSVVETLARDREIAVAGPVLADSPLLSEEFLQELIESGPVQGAVQAIAGRQNLPATVADAVVRHDDDEAVATLLRNQSAQIREETLDLLVERGAGRTSWHLPLVARPKLSARAAMGLARYVAGHLLERLAGRDDLDPAVAASVYDTVRSRIEAEGEAGGPPDTDPQHDRARRLHEAGQLDATAILTAAETGEREFAIASLALLSDMPERAVRKVTVLHSAKGMVALAWKAGLAMDDAVALQTGLARVPPDDAIRPADGGGYPLSADDMEWQLEFFRD